MIQKKVKTPQRRVRLFVGITKNIGDYSSIRVDAGYERDLLPDEKPEEAFDKVNSLVLSQLKIRLHQALLAMNAGVEARVVRKVR